MAKAIEAFMGHDSYGRHIHAAVREDGQWFSRHWGFNGYGNGWLKWKKDQELPRLEDGRVEWGFKTLEPINPEGLRLPN